MTLWCSPCQENIVTEEPPQWYGLGLKQFMANSEELGSSFKGCGTELTRSALTEGNQVLGEGKEMGK